MSSTKQQELEEENQRLNERLSETANRNSMWLLVGAGMVFVVMTGGLIFGHFGDTCDDIDTAEYGRQLCESMGMQYDHRELINSKAHNGNSIPKIYCKPVSDEKKIIDSLVVEVK